MFRRCSEPNDEHAMRNSQVWRILLSLTVFVAVAMTGWAQDTTPSSEQLPGKAVGTLVYFEGSVEVAHSGQDWSAAKIDQFLRPTHTIRTGSNASAEIRWSDGTSTVLGPESTQSIAALSKRAQQEVNSSEGKGVVQKFVDLFAEEGKRADDPGGIRRGQPSVSFTEAARTYQNEHYRKAVRKLHLFLEQNPLSPEAKKVRLALGHCYLELNNPLQAKAELEAIVQTYPDHEIADRAQTVLDVL